MVGWTWRSTNAGIVGFTGDLAEEPGESFDHLADECRASPDRRTPQRRSAVPGWLG
jgi:hypothetical protein